MPLLLPLAVAIDLVARIETAGFEQAFGQAQSHGRVVAPATARQVVGAAAQQVAHGRKRAGRAELSGSGKRVAHREADECSQEAIAKIAGRGQRAGVEKRVAFGFRCCPDTLLQQ